MEESHEASLAIESKEHIEVKDFITGYQKCCEEYGVICDTRVSVRKIKGEGKESKDAEEMIVKGIKFEEKTITPILKALENTLRVDAIT